LYAGYFTAHKHLTDCLRCFYRRCYARSAHRHVPPSAHSHRPPLSVFVTTERRLSLSFVGHHHGGRRWRDRVGHHHVAVGPPDVEQPCAHRWPHRRVGARGGNGVDPPPKHHEHAPLPLRDGDGVRARRRLLLCV